MADDDLTPVRGADRRVGNPKGDHEITRLLSSWGEGDGEAFDGLMSLVYDELTRLASRALRGESPGHTLTTHALVHESYLNLVVKNVGEWQSRAQFFALASRVMRRILIDHARRRRAVKRGGGQIHLTLGNRASAPATPFDHLMDLDEALTRLSERDARLGEVVECRFFGGMTVDETADALGVSRRTIERDWTRAKAYLYRDLTADASSTLL